MSKRSANLPGFLRPIDRRVTAGGVVPRPASALVRAVLFGERFVVSRALLHFERIERPAGRADERVRRAVELAARNRAPFTDPGLSISWGQHYAIAWSWDRARLERLGVPAKAWIVPEPALAAPAEPPAGDFRLRELQDGYEGQVFRRGELFASRFWERRPSQTDLDLFVRSCGLHGQDDETARPASAIETAEGRVRDHLSRVTPLHAGLAALLLVGTPLLYQAGSQVRINLELQAARSQLSTVVQESSAQFDALQRYQANSARLDSYRTALDLAHPLAPATELAETAQAIDGQLNRFRIVPGRIEAVLGTRTETDPADIVRALEETPSLANVEIRRARAQGDWEVQADLVAAGTPQEPES